MLRYVCSYGHPECKRYIVVKWRDLKACRYDEAMTGTDGRFPAIFQQKKVTWEAVHMHAYSQNRQR